MLKRLKLFLAASSLVLSPVAAHAAPSVVVSDITVNENVGSAHVGIYRTYTGQPTVVNFSEIDGTAKAGTDYTPITGSVTFGNKDSVKFVDIPIINDTALEPTESFYIKITGVKNANVTRGSAIITILDDDKFTCWDGTVITGTQQCPIQPPPPTTNPPPQTTVAGEATIADNFTGGIEVTKYGPNGTGGTPGPSADPVGAFRMFCTAGPLLYDDPIVKAGQPGTSHLHQFFGNTAVNAFSNYQSLRTTGDTTCGGAPFNRSAYWFPAMLDGLGNAVKPDYINLYYKRNPMSDPMCSLTSAEHLGQCVDLPNGIRYVFGYNTKTNTGGPNDLNSQDHWETHYECWGSVDGSVTPGTATGRYSTISDVAAAGCPVGARLMIMSVAPNCWNGTELVAADFRSNMVYGNGTYYAGQMFNACPADHQYVIPDIQVQISFTVGANLAGWHVSSDEMAPPGTANGATFHMDYWEAWSPTIKATWHQYCLDGHLSCSSGDLGNGTEIIGADMPVGGFPKGAVVPLTTISK